MGSDWSFSQSIERLASSVEVAAAVAQQRALLRFVHPEPQNIDLRDPAWLDTFR